MVHDVILNGPSRMDDLAKAAITLQTTIPSLIQKFEDFVYEGGLAFCVTEKDSSTILNKCADIINRILTNDLSIIQNLTRETSVAAGRILQFIALQTPGAFSQPKLANELKISPTTSTIS